MRAAAFGLLCLGLFCAAGMAWAGEAAATAPDAETLKKQLAELKQKEDAVRAKRDELRATVRKSPELTALREAYDKAQAAYDEKKKTDEAYAAAGKAEQEARDAFHKLVKEKLEANAEAKALREKTPESKQAEKEIGKKLDELRRTIENSDEADIKAAREKREATAKARQEAHDAEALAALRKPRDEARAAHDAKAKDLEAGNADLAATVKEREELRGQVHDLEKKIEEALAAQKKAGAAEK